MIRLERNMGEAPYPQAGESSKAFSCLLNDYHSPAILRLCTQTYSKLEAIRQFSAHLPCDDEAEDIVRALLTDRGLLFAQTRERFYTEKIHSWRHSKENGAFYAHMLEDMGVDRDTDFPTRVKCFARQAYDKYGFPTSFGRMSQALEAMLQDCKEEQFPKIVDCEDVGYCKGALGALEQSSDAQGTWTDLPAAEAIMEEWLQTVRVTFDDRTAVSGWDYLREKVNFTTIESYKFLSDILPFCNESESKYQFCRTNTGPYQPVLYASQDLDWQEQVRRFRAENLSLWSRALPALEQYLYPDLRRFGRDACPSDSSTSNHSPYVKRLKNAFRAYLSAMEPENITANIDVVAQYFVWSVRGIDNSDPLFMDMPAIIFHLFRSPVFRYFYQYEDRNWTLGKVVENACLYFTLPITMQSLDADQALYLAIVDVCESYCRDKRITFHASSWRALWSCIQQCVMCLPVQKADLFTVRYDFRSLLRFGKMGYSFFDALLSDQLEMKCSAYISLWRTLINQKLRGSRTSKKSTSSSDDAPTDKRSSRPSRESRLNEFRDTVSAYRVLFQNPDTTPEQVFRYLWPICSATGFNRIPFLPGREERKEMAEDWGFLPRSKHGPFHFIEVSQVNQNGKSTKAPNRSTRKAGEEQKREPRSIDMVLTEWLMLQCSCEQAQRELMSAVYELLKKR